MKKHLCLIVVACLALSALAACGSGSSSSSTAATEAAAAVEEAVEEVVEEVQAAVAAEPSIVLTWSEVNGEEYGGTKGAYAFKEKIEELSGGDISVELYLNGTIGSEAESMQGIQMGTLDIFRGNASSLANYGADEISLTGLPFLFEDMEEFYDMSVSPLGQEFLDSVDEADCGYVALGWLVEGPRSLFITEATYNKIGSPDEFTLDMMDGLKIRVPETDLMVGTMDALHSSATPIAYSELYTSLQSGVVDGAENDVINYIGNSFYEVAPYFVPDAHTFGCGVILMNKDRYNSFTDEQKGWIAEAAAAAGEACYAYNTESDQAAYDSFEDIGAVLLPVGDIDNWSAACASVYATYDDASQEIINRVLANDFS